MKKSFNNISGLWYKYERVFSYRYLYRYNVIVAREIRRLLVFSPEPDVVDDLQKAIIGTSRPGKKEKSSTGGGVRREFMVTVRNLLA